MAPRSGRLVRSWAWILNHLDHIWIAVLSAVIFGVMCSSCGLLGGPSPAEIEAQERSERVVRAVEDYVAGRIGPDQALADVLRAYREAREVPPAGGDPWEMIGLALGAAVPAAAGAVGLLNRKRNASRALELAARDEEMEALRDAIRGLEGRGAE